MKTFGILVIFVAAFFGLAIGVFLGQAARPGRTGTEIIEAKNKSLDSLLGPDTMPIRNVETTDEMNARYNEDLARLDSAIARYKKSNKEAEQIILKTLAE